MWRGSESASRAGQCGVQECIDCCVNVWDLEAIVCVNLSNIDGDWLGGAKGGPLSLSR